MTDALATLSLATTMLAEARTFKDAKNIRDLAAAAQEFARAKKLGTEAMNYATDIRLEAERLMGLKLIEARTNGTFGQGTYQNSQVGSSVQAADLGISWNESAAAQVVASVPDVEWQAKKESAIKAGAKSTRAVARSVKRDQERARKQAEMAAQPAPGECGVWHGDMREVGTRIADNSVDLILTDPPYPGEFLPLFSDLSTFSARVLKPGGLCLVYSGQIFLPEVMRRLSESLNYVWTFAIKHSGGNQRIFKANINTAWKPVILLCKPLFDVWWDSFVDVTSGGREKDLHEWQQAESEAAYFIEHLSLPGQVVVDPFCGSGTVLSAAKKLGRQYQGIEMDGEHVQRACARLKL